MKRNSRLATLGGGFLLAAVSLTFGSQDATAADHMDSSNAIDDQAVDLADYYAWGTDDGNVVLIATFAGISSSSDGAYDADTLYTLHIDTNDDGESETQIHVRFGQNMLDEWGVQFEGVPGAAASFNGAVATDLTDGNASAHAGPFEDPFFFDLDGFNATAAALGADGDPADLMFDAFLDLLAGDPATPEDAFAGFNTTAIVVEFAAADLGATAFSTWVTASRFGEDGGTGSSSSSGGGSSSSSGE